MKQLNFKNIHIGALISQKIKENNLDLTRICNSFNCDEHEIEEMLKSESLPTDKVLAWSKLLEYDLFRIYSHHLLLFSPPKANYPKNKMIPDKPKSNLPEFRKNVYTVEIIQFIMEQISSGEKTKSQVIKEYGIPKPTLYKWIEKYNHNQEP